MMNTTARPGEEWALSGPTLPVTHHVMKTSNHTIPDRSPPGSTRTAPSATKGHAFRCWPPPHTPIHPIKYNVCPRHVSDNDDIGHTEDNAVDLRGENVGHRFIHLSILLRVITYPGHECLSTLPKITFYHEHIYPSTPPKITVYPRHVYLSTLLKIAIYPRHIHLSTLPKITVYPRHIPVNPSQGNRLP